MQERYCTCGEQVFVQFVPNNAKVLAMFWSLTLRAGGKINRCPSCGGALHIDALR
ncbi:MAG: hypothetical protein AB7E47_00935 [Desulfovibrionaceae bacterium]